MIKRLMQYIRALLVAILWRIHLFHTRTWQFNAIYSLATNTTVTTTGAACGDALATSSNSPKIMEVGINLLTATASTYGLGRSGNTPTQTAPVKLLAENPADPTGQTGCAVAWSVAPTVPTNFFRRMSLAATAGTGVIWTFPRGLTLAVSASMLIWNLATNSASMNFHFVADE